MADYKVKKIKSLADEAKQKGSKLPEFAKANIHADGNLGKIARMAYMREAVHGGGKSSMKKAGDGRNLGAKLYQIG